MTTPPDLANLAPQVAIVIVFLYFLYKVSTRFADSLKDLTDSNRQIANETKKAAREAKDRNGHLAELVAQTQTTNKKLMDRNLKVIKAQTIKQQNIEKQIVEKVEK